MHCARFHLPSRFNRCLYRTAILLLLSNLTFWSTYRNKYGRHMFGNLFVCEIETVTHIKQDKKNFSRCQCYDVKCQNVQFNSQNASKIDESKIRE